MELHAVVVDDEPLAREELCYLLERMGGVVVVGQAGNGLDAVALVEQLKPHVAFLDVQMPGLSGFEVARQLLDRHTPSHIVFVTAFNQYAVDAFEVNAVDYLLKPVELERLEQAVRRIRGLVASDQLADDRLERLARLMAGRHPRPAQLALKIGERFNLVPATDLIYATLEGDTIQIVTNEAIGTSNYRTLEELQSRLDPDLFWRVHRAYLVNISQIKEIVPWFSRNFILRMRDAKQTEIPVSRSQTKRLREYLRL
jgi:two-component system, LytTR family, response regulator LytT